MYFCSDKSSKHELVSQRISRALTTGKVKKIEQEEAFLLPDVTQRMYDLTTMNLIIDPVYIADRISWQFDSPFPDNIDAIVKEYKTARNLNPVKIIVLGPPASGKTKVARYLADHYDIHYIHVKSLIANTIDSLVSTDYLFQLQNRIGFLVEKRFVNLID